MFLVFLLCLVKGLSGETIHEVRKNETLEASPANTEFPRVHCRHITESKTPTFSLLEKSSKFPIIPRKRLYTKSEGDSLGGIAKRFGANPSSLALINKIERPDLIRIGQKANHPPYENGSPPPAPSLIPAGTLSLLKHTRVKTGKWERIVIHHSATPVDDAMNMDRVHKARGMKNGLAYHFVISNGSRKAYDGEIVMGNRWKNQLDGGHMKKAYS